MNSFLQKQPKFIGKYDTCQLSTFQNNVKDVMSLKFIFIKLQIADLN